MTIAGAICANCVEHPATHRGRLDRGGPLYDLCDECELPAREGHGIERGYEPPGGLPTSAEAARGVRRAMGAERYEREAEADKRRGQRPSPAADPGDRDIVGFRQETDRRIRTKACESNLRSSRERKLV